MLRVVYSMYQILTSRRKLRGGYTVKKCTACVHLINFLFVTSKALANKMLLPIQCYIFDSIQIVIVYCGTFCLFTMNVQMAMQ